MLYIIQLDSFHNLYLIPAHKWSFTVKLKAYILLSFIKDVKVYTQAMYVFDYSHGLNNNWKLLIC